MRDGALQLLEVLDAALDHAPAAVASCRPRSRSQCTRATRGRRSSPRWGSARASSRRSTQGGILWVPQAASDVFFVDLHKAERDYSPTTMYRDYAINRELFHWESQSRQTPRQPTVQRYINHEPRGTRVLLFVRERKKLRARDAGRSRSSGRVTTSITSGERPVAFTWRCRRRCPRSCSKPPEASRLPDP